MSDSADSALRFSRKLSGSTFSTKLPFRRSLKNSDRDAALRSLCVPHSARKDSSVIRYLANLQKFRDPRRNSVDNNKPKRNTTPTQPRSAPLNNFIGPRTISQCCSRTSRRSTTLGYRLVCHLHFLAEKGSYAMVSSGLGLRP